MKKDKESSVDIVEESKNDVFNLPFDQAFPSTEELSSDNLTLEDAHVAPRRVQGQMNETLICIEPPEDIISDIMAECAGLQFVDDFKIILARCTGSAYDVGAAINGKLDVNLSVEFKGDGYIADSGVNQTPMYYHTFVIDGVEALLEQVGESLEVAGLQPLEHEFAPNMMVGTSTSAISPPQSKYTWNVDELIVDDESSKVPVRVTSSGAKIKRDESQNDANGEEKEAATGWNLSDLVSPGLGSNTMEDINQSTTDPNIFENPSGRMAQMSATTTGMSPRGSKIVSIKNGGDRYIYNLSVPGQRLMMIGNSMPRLAPASVPVDSLFEEGVDTLTHEDAMLGDHLADLVAGKKTGDVEAPYSSGDGPLGVRFEDDKEYDIVRGAQLKELKRGPTNLNVDDKELETGREQYFLPDSIPDKIEEVEYDLPWSDSSYSIDVIPYRYGDYIHFQFRGYPKDHNIVSREGVLYYTHIMSTNLGPYISLSWSGIAPYEFANTVHQILLGEDPVSPYTSEIRQSSDPVIESIIDQLIVTGKCRQTRSDAWIMRSGQWIPADAAGASAKVQKHVLFGRSAQVDWENATPEQLRLREILKSKAKTPEQLGMRPYKTRDSTEPVSDLPADTQVRIDKAQEDFPGTPSVLTHHTVKGPTRDDIWAPPNSVQRIPGTNMIRFVRPDMEPGEYTLEDLATDVAYALDIGVDPETGQLLASWTPDQNWHLEDDEFSDSTDPIIDDVLPQIVEFMRADHYGTATKMRDELGRDKWELISFDSRNVDTRLAGSNEGQSVTIDDEIEKDAVGLIEGPTIDENAYGTDFSRADQAIPRPRGMDKFIHRK